MFALSLHFVHPVTVNTVNKQNERCSNPEFGNDKKNCVCYQAYDFNLFCSKGETNVENIFVFTESTFRRNVPETFLRFIIDEKFYVVHSTSLLRAIFVISFV